MILTLTPFYRMDVTPKQVAERRRLGKGARHWVKKDILSGMAKLGFSKTAIECVAKTYQMHHIVPLSMGGGITRDNWALTHPFIHAWAHKVIDAQKDKEIVFVPVAKNRNRLWQLPFMLRL